MHPVAPHQRDFAPNLRLPRIAVLAAAIGVTSTLAAVVLLNLIHLFTNLFFFGRWSFADRAPAGHAPGAWVIAVPVIGGLIVGLMARFGSEKIRGHGIPEAIEAILSGKSRMSPKVAILKPLSSGIVIGSGGPFGAEGPIIMTGGALGSLIAQCFKVTAAERKTLLVAGAAVFGTPVAAVLLAVELLLFEWRPRSFLPVALACAVAGFARALCFGADQKHRAYPVLRDGRLVAMLDRTALERLDAEHGPHAGVGEALRGVSRGPWALTRETCRLVATRLAVHGLERLPVIADEASPRLVGLVARSDLVKPALRHFDEVHKRERFHGIRLARATRSRKRIARPG